ncbi:phosphate transport system ATP-binding protein [Subtercola frigoramans]|uniref:Phosphate transport system ATP-binding protein n=1 Tax=Subtercola frigoramans TaxID=120298 RepID=A0ABS2L654_9MICO|nr:phosphate transport system ATP-binding protein [Subtercola frigoramans]
MTDATATPPEVPAEPPVELPVEGPSTASIVPASAPVATDADKTEVLPAQKRRDKRVFSSTVKAPKPPKAPREPKPPKPPKGAAPYVRVGTPGARDWTPPAGSPAAWVPPASGGLTPLPGTAPGYAAGTVRGQATTAVLERPPLAALEAKNISAWFGDHQVLDRVSLTMPAGVITSLIGPSGCGKSTFLRILNRMHELVPSASLAGEVLIDHEDIYSADRKLVDARKSIGMVFQKPNPFPAMSIYDNVIAGLRLTGTQVGRAERDFLVESCLTKAGLWKEVRDRLRAPGGGLSGGQQQRLCIARSLAVTPRVLLMDEPCSALDPTSTRVIEETMLELVNDVTIVIVTHNMQQAQRVSTQCAFFLASQGKPGGIVEYGDTEAMFSKPIDSRTYDYVNGVFG